MGFLVDFLRGLDAAAAVTAALAVLAILLLVIAELIKHRKDIARALNQWAKRKQEKDELLKMVYENKKAIEQYAENRVHDREQSFEIQKQLTDAIDTIIAKLEALSEKHDSFEERQNKRVRAELKDRISRLYQYYHEKQEWNDMEKEALIDLIEEYETAGGVNSFVHSVVLPESYQWKITERR